MARVFSRVVADEVVGEGVLHELQGLVEEVLLVDSGVLFGYGAVAAGEDGDVVADVLDLEEAGLDSVVEVGGEVGDLVGEVDDLGLERGALAEEVGGEFGVLVGAVVAGVLDDAFADAEGEVEAAVGGVALLEVLDDAEGVEVVVEAAAVALEALVEGAFAGVAEGRVADVVDQGEGLGEVLVEAEGGGGGTGYLGDLHGVGEAAAEVVGGAAGEDLGLAGEAAKGPGLDDALAVALEGGSSGSGGGWVDAGEERVAVVRGDGAEVERFGRPGRIEGVRGGGLPGLWRDGAVRDCHAPPPPLVLHKVFKTNYISPDFGVPGETGKPGGSRALNTVSLG